jgi:non-ribosomal peptide synthetase component F/acyl carrier protein
MNRHNIEAIYPLSPTQQGLLFHAIHDRAAGGYYQQLTCRIEGNLNIPFFKKAWQKVIERHSILRTFFVWEGHDEPFQVVRQHVKLPWQQHDWRDLSIDEQNNCLEQFLQNDRQSYIDLTCPPLLRLTLIKLEKTAYQFTWTFPPLIVDGWSQTLIAREVLSCYKAFCQGQEPKLSRPRPYREYIKWVQRQDPVLAQAFWCRVLEGFLAPTPFGIDHSRTHSGKKEKEYTEQHALLSPEQTKTLQSFCRKHQLTLSTVVQGAWALLLSRYSGESDVLFGLTVSGRPHHLENIETMVGQFINTLPLRVRVSHGAKLIPWLMDLQMHQVEMREYEHSLLVLIQGCSQVPRGRPLFESILVFQNFPLEIGFEQNFNQKEDIILRNVRAVERTNYPITLTVEPGITLNTIIAYDKDRFTAGAIVRMLHHLHNLLNSISSNPQQRLAELTMLADSEYQQLRPSLESKHTGHSKSICLHRAFEAQAAQTPDAIAISMASTQLTFRSLNCKANQLARLLKKDGVGPEVPIAVVMQPAPETIIALLAVLKAGGAYAFIDSRTPQEKIGHYLNHGLFPTALVDSDITLRSVSRNTRVIALDANWHKLKKEDSENLPVIVQPNNLAAIVYNVTSADEVNGALFSHHALFHGLPNDWKDKLPGDAWCQTAPWEPANLVSMLWFPLINGMRVVISPATAKDGSTILSRYLAKQQVTHLALPPSLLQSLLDTDAKNSEVDVPKYWFVSEKAITSALRHHYAASATQGQLVPYLNLPESTIKLHQPALSFQNRPTATGQTSSGRSQSIYILGSEMQPAPIGVPGTLYVGDDSIGRGYYHQPGKTAEKFIPDPFSRIPGKRLLQCDEVAYYQDSGEIQWLDRRRNIVKLPGYTVSLRKMQEILLTYAHVREAIIQVDCQHNNKPRLTAYIVPESHFPETESLLSALEALLADNDLPPPTFVVLKTFPQTVYCRVNREELPEPACIDEVAFIPPRTPTEKTLVTIWKEILELEKVGINDVFSHLGGHSLLATRITARIQEAFEVEIDVRSLFEKPTVADLAAIIDDKKQQLT